MKTNSAQKAEQTKAPDAPSDRGTSTTLPVLDEDDLTNFNGVVLLAQAVQTECAALEASKRFNDQKARVNRRFETKYPGFSFDWNKATLVAK